MNLSNLQQQQQSYLQLDNKVPGRACFLATNFINTLVHALILFDLYHEVGSPIIIFLIWIGYLVIHYLLGFVSAIEQNQSLHKFYRISCIVLIIIHALVFAVSLICTLVMTTKDQSGNTFYSLVMVIYLVGLIWSGVELLIDYSNYRYINQLINSSSNQYFLGFSQPTQFNQIFCHQPVQAQQLNQPYVLQYPQLQQQISQQNVMQFRQQPFTQPLSVDQSSHQINKQPLILQNGYNQFQ